MKCYYYDGEGLHLGGCPVLDITPVTGTVELNCYGGTANLDHLARKYPLTINQWTARYEDLYKAQNTAALTQQWIHVDGHWQKMQVK